jgi:S-adenosylmethionine hydrolase
MKAVLARRAPHAAVIDLSHSIVPQNIRQAAILLHDSCFWFPPETVHVAVVDPGVGTKRRLLVARLKDQWFVGPDNGLISLWAERDPPELVVVLDRPEFWHGDVSNTFHGRDIMAPVAAHLVSGVSPAELGSPTTTWQRLAWPRPQWQDGFVEAHVLLIDHFGNLLTDVTQAMVAQRGVRLTGGSLSGGQSFRVVSTYGEAPAGTLVGLFGSQGRFEVAVVQGNAAVQCQAAVGDVVRIEWCATDG